MTEFRTRRKDKQVFPIASGKEYRRVDDYEESPSEEKVLEEKIQEQKARKKHKPEKPSFSTRSDVHQDIKRMMHKDDAVDHGKRDYKQYKTKLKQNADKQYRKEYHRAEKRQKKEQKREKKEKESEEKELQEQRQDTNMGEQST